MNTDGVTGKRLSAIANIIVMVFQLFLPFSSRTGDGYDVGKQKADKISQCNWRKTISHRYTWTVPSSRPPCSSTTICCCDLSPGYCILTCGDGGCIHHADQHRYWVLLSWLSAVTTSDVHFEKSCFVICVVIQTVLNLFSSKTMSNLWRCDNLISMNVLQGKI